MVAATLYTFCPLSELCCVKVVFCDDVVKPSVVKLALVIAKPKSSPSALTPVEVPPFTFALTEILNDKVVLLLSAIVKFSPLKTIVDALMVALLLIKVLPLNKAIFCMALLKLSIPFPADCDNVIDETIVGKASLSLAAPPSRMVNCHTCTPCEFVVIVDVFSVEEIVVASDDETATTSAAPDGVVMAVVGIVAAV